VRTTSEDGVMRDQDQRYAVCVQFLQERDDFAPGMLIEISGGLVREDCRWPHDHRAGDGDALTLAAGKLVGTMARAFDRVPMVYGLGAAASR
jgi:hypothetical protein